MIKKDQKIYSVNPFYFIFGNVNGYFVEFNGNKQLFVLMKPKKKIKNNEELSIKIRDLIRLITKNSDDYDEKYVKIKFDLDGILPLNKRIEIPIVTIVVSALFHENNKYFPQVFLGKCL